MKKILRVGFSAYVLYMVASISYRTGVARGEENKKWEG